MIQVCEVSPGPFSPGSVSDDAASPFGPAALPKQRPVSNESAFITYLGKDFSLGGFAYIGKILRIEGDKGINAYVSVQENSADHAVH